MEPCLVVTGAAGKKSGGAFVRRLCLHADEVRRAFPGGIRAIVRPTSDLETLKRRLPEAELFTGELTDPAFLNRAMEGADTVLHIAGIHWSVPVTEAAARASVRRLILVHTTGIYSKYKEAGEEYRKIDAAVSRICQEKGIVLTILRPTMIYGNLTDRNIAVFLRMVDRLPLMPVVRGARYLLQPVYYEDLGEAYYRVLTHEAVTAGKCYDLSGGAPILLRDLLSEMGRQLGRKRVRFLSVPHWLAYGGAVGLFGLSLGRLDLREKVQRLCEDRAYPHDEARRDFGYDPLPFAEGVRNEILEYLNKKQS